jgi:tetratricopeptide (TPR) repeat protein
MTPVERLSLASIYEKKGETELALREYEKAAEAGSAEAYFSMGNIYLRAKEFDRAERSYLMAIKINPASGAFHNNLGWVYMEKGELFKAERSVRDALGLDPARRFIYLDTLGVILTRQGRFIEAERTLTEAARLAPRGDNIGRIEIYSHMGDLYRRMGDIEKAVRMEERIRSLR